MAQLQTAAVTVSLTELPRTGEAKLLIRLTTLDKSLVDRVAAQIGMNQADLLRVLVVNGAKAIAEELERDDDRHFDDVVHGGAPIDLTGEED